MLSIFPDLFTYSLIAPFVLRIALGSFFVLQGIRRHKEDSMGWNALWVNKKLGTYTVAAILAKIQIIIGVLLFVGLFTQVAGILALLFVWVEWFKKRTNGTTIPFQELWLAVLVTVIGLSLLFLGAGSLAIDLPL